jgi:hypothetical protein
MVMGLVQLTPGAEPLADQKHPLVCAKTEALALRASRANNTIHADRPVSGFLQYSIFIKIFPSSNRSSKHSISHIYIGKGLKNAFIKFAS